MGTDACPDRKSICRNQMKDWEAVSFTARIKAFKKSVSIPITGFFQHLNGRMRRRILKAMRRT